MRGLTHESPPVEIRDSQATDGTQTTNLVKSYGSTLKFKLNDFMIQEEIDSNINKTRDLQNTGHDHEEYESRLIQGFEDGHESEEGTQRDQEVIE